MKSGQEITPAKRKRLLKTFGPCPADYTHDALERLLNVLYGLYNHVYTAVELRQIIVSVTLPRFAGSSALSVLNNIIVMELPLAVEKLRVVRLTEPDFGPSV